jgi:putative ABC transport system permease protein
MRTKAMWRNYWTVAVRALAKNRTYSIINIVGLAIGMAACVLILLYIRYEKSYDKWIPDVENTYELQSWYPHPKAQPPGFFQMSTYSAQAALEKDFPQIEATPTCRITTRSFSRTAKPIRPRTGCSQTPTSSRS